MKKIIAIKHHLDDYECMWNGIEDIYMNETNEKLPPNYFFVLAGMNSFVYLNTPKGDIKKMICFGDGRTEKMYSFLAPYAGFSYHHTAHKNFLGVLKEAKTEILSNHPVILGALDMYYLPYLKMYKNVHIPIHYIMMIGFDEEKQLAYVCDCGREGIMEVPFSLLEQAMAVNNPGLSKPFTVCTIRFTKKINPLTIAEEAFRERAKLFLTSNSNISGEKGFRKFIKDLPNYRSSLTKEDYDKLFTNMLMFMGTVPALPNVLLHIDEPDTLKFNGGYDKIITVCNEMSKTYQQSFFTDIKPYYLKCEELATTICEIVTSYLAHSTDQMDKLPALFTAICDNITNSFHLIMRG